MEELENAIIDLLNDSPLPLEAKRYVLKHVFVLVDNQYQKLTAEREVKPDE